MRKFLFSILFALFCATPFAYAQDAFDSFSDPSAVDYQDIDEYPGNIEDAAQPEDTAAIHEEEDNDDSIASSALSSAQMVILSQFLVVVAIILAVLILVSDFMDLLQKLKERAIRAVIFRIVLMIVTFVVAFIPEANVVFIAGRITIKIMNFAKKARRVSRAVKRAGAVAKAASNQQRPG